MKVATRRAIVVCSIVWLAACAGHVQTGVGSGATVPAITATDLRTRLYFYADDSMMGRKVGTPGNMMATRYIESEVRRMGLEPAGDSGTFFQDIHPDSIRGMPRGTQFPPGTARNVVAILRGSDPALRNEYVGIGAHNDHIGIRSTPADYDSLRTFNIELDRTSNPRWDRSIAADRRIAERAA